MRSDTWQQLIRNLLERERRPAVLVADTGRLLFANRSFALLLPQRAALRGVDFPAHCLQPASRAPFEAARARARAGEPALVTVALRRGLFPSRLVLRLEHFAVGARSSAVIGVMVDLAAPEESQLRPAAGATYEVALDRSGRPLHVSRIAANDDRVRAVDEDTPCWATVFGAAAECAACPVRQLKEGGQVTTVRRAGCAEGPWVVVTARRRDANLATVTVLPVDDTVAAGLAAARVSRAAEEARLSARETEVLQLLIAGESIGGVATALRIAVRTAKYHQRNVLTKLGLTTRADLTRLLR